jgi:hypothetical protein
MVVDDEGCRRSAGGRAKVVVDEEGCRCSAGDSSTPVWSPSSSFQWLERQWPSAPPCFSARESGRGGSWRRHQLGHGSLIDVARTVASWQPIVERRSNSAAKVPFVETSISCKDTCTSMHLLSVCSSLWRTCSPFMPL